MNRQERRAAERQAKANPAAGARLADQVFAQAEQLRRELEPGTPAVVSFQRRSLDTVLGDFRTVERQGAGQPAEKRL